MTQMIGSRPDELPVSQMLGRQAFSDNAIITSEPGEPCMPGHIAFELESDTTLVVKARGADGVLRTATITLT